MDKRTFAKGCLGLWAMTEWKGTNDAYAKAEVPTLWPSDAKSRLIGKDPDAEKDLRQKEKGAAEDEMAR